MPEPKNPGGTVLAAWREKSGKTQTECARDVGVRQATWSEWEAGAKNPQIKHALKIAEISEGAVPLTCWVHGAEPGGAPPVPAFPDASAANGTAGRVA